MSIEINAMPRWEAIFVLPPFVVGFANLDFPRRCAGGFQTGLLQKIFRGIGAVHLESLRALLYGLVSPMS